MNEASLQTVAQDWGIIGHEHAINTLRRALVTERVRHPLYGKTVQRTKRLYAHDELNDVHVGDRVRVGRTLLEVRP